MTITIAALRLFDLPDDLLKVLLSRRHLPPTTLVQVACTCKAAAAVALPELYSDLLVPSFAALPLIYSTLQARPKLAQHVKSVTASRYFVSSYDVREHEAAIQECRMCPDSPIVSISKVTQRLGLDTLGSKLLMPWLVRIARICPNLSAVDLNQVTCYPIDLNSLMLGLSDLARILRARLGRFRSRGYPFSCILVNDRLVSPNSSITRFARDIQFVDAVDYSSKHISVTDAACPYLALGSRFILVPFRDLVTLEDQPNWSIGDATLRNHSAKSTFIREQRWVVSSWLKSKDELWLKGGLVDGQDRVFDLSLPPGLVKGKVTLTLLILQLLGNITSAIHVDSARQCNDISMEGPDPAAMASFPQPTRQLVVDRSLGMYATLPAQPLASVTSLHLSVAGFVFESSVAQFMSFLNTGMPNLTQLQLFKAACPVDYIVYHADPLIRRSAPLGKPLQTLSVGSFKAHSIHAEDGWPYKHTSSPADWPLASNRRLLSLLGSGSPTCHLKHLELVVQGRGVEELLPANAATVAIHPDILRNLRSLRLESVKLFLSPPAFAQPDSPSFLPLAHTSLSARNMCPVNHALSLPNLEKLTMSSNAFNLSTTRTSASASRCPSFVLHALPRAPRLTHFSMFTDDIEVRSPVYTSAIVAPILRQFPRLECARFANLMPLEARRKWENAILDEFFVPCPRELAPCPRLRCVQVNATKPIEYYQWLVSREAQVGSGLEPVEMSSLAVECDRG